MVNSEYLLFHDKLKYILNSEFPVPMNDTVEGHHCCHTRNWTGRCNFSLFYLKRLFILD